MTKDEILSKLDAASDSVERAKKALDKGVPGAATALEFAEANHSFYVGLLDHATKHGKAG